MQIREGIFQRGNKCYRVVRVFDECDMRREMITYEVSKLYRNGEYLGDCTIKYELDRELCAMLKSI
jgi:glutaredoxin-related protein